MAIPVSGLSEGCKIGNDACIKTSDVTSGTCRTIKYSTKAGPVQVQVCDKGSAYELYRQAAPNTDFSACTGGGCVDKRTGFARFTSTTLSTRVRVVRSCTPYTEVCDGKDNDCDGQVDENNVCVPTCAPATEICDGKDNDCDKLVDENNICAPVCTPTAEVCDGKDNDCDTQVDENDVCAPPPPACTPTTEVCDGRDNDCDAQVDENNVCAATVTPLLAGSSAGAFGQTRDQNFELMVDSWFKSQNVIQRIPTSAGTALWVPWMRSASSSSVSDLQSGTNCNIGTVDLNNNCLVTDEFSQVGMVLAMSTRHQADFDSWVTTLRQLKSSQYGSLPVWKASRTATGISTAVTGNQDSASDADARVITALYTAANNDAFTSTQRASYKSLADTMANDMLRYDFAHVSKPGRNGVVINNWLASGAATGTGNGLTWNDFSYGGYYGDVTIALLAAYKSTGDTRYVTHAKDTVNAYLLAANFDGTRFSVPPKAFKWDTSGTTPRAVCTNNCASNSWDDSDAVRAVTMCKALYYAQLNNVDLGTDLKAYCQAWMNSGGVRNNAYAIQYTFAGAPLSPVQGGMYENGLGSSLNFHLNKQDLAAKLDEVASHYSVERGTFDWTPSDGVYRSAFYKVNLGTAIGRDIKAFSGASGSTVPPVPTCSPTTEVCDGKDNDCDSQVDENNVCAPPPPACTPTTEVCDGRDNDCDGRSDEDNVCAPAPAGVAGLNVICTTSVGGPSCTKTSDVNDGSCRTAKFNSGTEQVMICDKGSAYEMYLQLHSGQTTTCVGTACVGPLTGFARWNK